MSTDIAKRLASIGRRLRALKAPRPVNLNQIALLEESWNFAVTLASGAEAHFEATIVCGDAPVVLGAIDGYNASVVEILPDYIQWDITGNTAIGLFKVYNDAVSTKSASIIIRVWGLNGLSASCVRTL